jgi:pimeloyl-ACP methyl ester carboxylesterase
MFKWMVLLCLALAGCTAPRNDEIYVDPLVYDPQAVARAETLVILIPGALTSRGMFYSAEAWADRPGYALAFYRFAGMEGMPLDRPLSIEGAGREIAAFANAYPDKRIRILGYSTGGPIGILAASEIRGDVRVAAMSSAVELAGGADTALRVAGDVVISTARAKSLRPEDVWLEYYRILLFGRNVRKRPEAVQTSDVYVARLSKEITLPDPDVPAAQSSDLRRWRLSEAIALDPAKVRFFVGLEDPVFSTRQTLQLARKLGSARVYGYPGQGHLLYQTRPDVFDDVLAWFEAPVE